MFLFSFGICFLALGANEAVVVDNYSSTIMILIYGFFFTGLFFRFSFIAGFLLSLFYVFVISQSSDTPPAVASSMETSLMVIVVILGLAAYQKELVSRRLFLTETRERERLSRQIQQDARHLQWLRTLAHFLRHEVRQPVAQINSSLELARMFGSDDARASGALDNATLSTQHVWNLIERASQATDAEAYVRQCRPAILDLSQLLMQLVADFEQTHSGLEFTLRRNGPAYVRADPTLVGQAIGNLLANATSFAVEHSVVEVQLNHTAQHAVVSVCN
ncbi:sensor histidine kinase, partial [Mesorhizobium sp. P5_C1]